MCAFASVTPLRGPVAREKRGSWYVNGFSIDDDEHQHPKSQASARGLKEGLTPAGLAVASRHHPGESGRRGSCVGGQGSGGGVWGDPGVRLHLLRTGDTVSDAPPVMYPPVGVPGPITVDLRRSARSDDKITTHTQLSIACLLRQRVY